MAIWTVIAVWTMAHKCMMSLAIDFVPSEMGSKVWNKKKNNNENKMCWQKHTQTQLHNIKNSLDFFFASFCKQTIINLRPVFVNYLFWPDAIKSICV